MPLPAGVETVTVSSAEPLVLPDGTLMQGRLIFTSPDLVTIGGQDVILGGSVEVPLVDGEFTVQLVATDATGMSPTGWTYRVTAALTNAPHWTRYISLPKAAANVVLADIVVPDPVAGEFNTLIDIDQFLTSGAFGEQLPVNHGLAAWTFDPVLAHNASLLTSGTVYLSKVHVSTAVSATRLYWWVTTAGASPAAGQNFVGLYNSSGQRLATTGVDADITSAGLKTTTIPAQSLTAGAFYWIAMVFNASTAPTVARATGSGGLASAVNVGLTAATLRFATNGTGQSSLPASITPASNSATGFGGPWAALGA